MHKVTGIGGFFFRAKDSDALMDWYRDNLGIDQPSWMQEAGETAFRSMDDPGDMFGDPSRVWSINFRVADLDGMTEQLRAAGTEVTVDPTVYEFGRFASCADPEGNVIQLWEPAD